MDYREEQELKEKAEKLADVEEEIHELTSKFGLEPYDVQNWLVDYEDMNKVSAYGGFQERYPHWRWGMKYDQKSKKSRYMNSAPYELVINSDPSHAYLQESNDEVIQKLVMAHVDGHSDFFAKNSWFNLLTDAETAVKKLSEHADRIRSYMEDPEIDRSEVEQWIDSVLTVEFNIDQHHPDYYKDALEDVEETEEKELKKVLEEKGFDSGVVDHVFRNSEQLKKKSEGPEVQEDRKEKDILRYLEEYGKAYDDEKGRAVEMEDWQNDIIRMIREESYYFAPQMMTKTMNEGWAAYWHTKVMSGENFAEDDEFIEFATAQAKVLSGGGMNPYKVGKELWEYIENKENRKEVYKELLKVEGITKENFEEKVDFNTVMDYLEDEELVGLSNENAEKLEEMPEVADKQYLEKFKGFEKIKEQLSEGSIESSEAVVELERMLDQEEFGKIEEYLSEDMDEKAIEKAEKEIVDADENPWKLLNNRGLASRHYSLLGKQKFLEEMPEEELGVIDVTGNEYESLEEAMENVDRQAGWEKMYQVRENYNDALFVKEFMTQEFVNRNNYFTYENLSDGQNSMPVATSNEAEDVKKKFLLKTLNFGKPRVEVETGNFRNKGGLLLEHDYNGIEMDLGQAFHTLSFLHDLWGRDVHLKTIVKAKDEEYQKEVEQLFNAMSLAAQSGSKLEDIDIPKPKEQGVLLSYDGDEFETEELDWEEVKHLSAEEVDYETFPEEWLL